MLPFPDFLVVGVLIGAFAEESGFDVPVPDAGADSTLAEVVMYPERRLALGPVMSAEQAVRIDVTAMRIASGARRRRRAVVNMTAFYR